MTQGNTVQPTTLETRKKEMGSLSDYRGCYTKIVKIIKKPLSPNLQLSNVAFLLLHEQHKLNESLLSPQIFVKIKL